MDLLLTDIRPAAPEQIPPGKLAETDVPEFAALLRDLPENATGPLSTETLPVPSEQTGLGNKFLKINILSNDLVARDGSIDEPGHRRHAARAGAADSDRERDNGRAAALAAVTGVER